MKKLFTFIKNLPRLYSIGGAVIIVAIGAIALHLLTRNAVTTTTLSGISHVTISSLSDLSSQSGPLPVTGKVTSLSQATILSQTSGEIITLSRTLGSSVSAGGIIAEFENSSQQAAVLQAQGAYDAAAASLAKVTGTSATNSGISSSLATQNAANAQTALVTAMQSLYATLDDSIHTKADVLFTTPHGIAPQLTFTTSDSQLTITLQNERSQLDTTITDAQTVAGNVTTSNADTSAAQEIADAQAVQTFINNLVTALNKAQTNSTVTPTILAGYQATIGATRSAVVAAMSSVTSAKGAYDSALSGAATASNSANSASTSDVASAQANLKQAQGSLDAARANLEKTIVRSPISGTIVSLPVHQGDYVGAFSQVAIVSNPGALEVLTDVTPDDAKSLAVNGKAVIEGTTNGIIVSIAPALDPTTNKIQVKVGIVGDQSTLTDGETVSLTLDRIAATSNSNTKTPTTITIPIISAKITPAGPTVFTVSASSTLVSHPITLGAILGDQVVVLSGITPDMTIVTDARGLAEGQTVVVDSH